MGEYMIPLGMRGGCVLTGLVLGALLNSLAGQVALSDPPEPNAAEAQSISAPTRDGEDVGVIPFGPLPVTEIPNAHPGTSTEIAARWSRSWALPDPRARYPRGSQ